MIMISMAIIGGDDKQKAHDVALHWWRLAYDFLLEFTIDLLKTDVSCYNAMLTT